MSEERKEKMKRSRENEERDMKRGERKDDFIFENV